MPRSRTDRALAARLDVTYPVTRAVHGGRAMGFRMCTTATARLLWFLGLLGICGLHRLYTGRVGTGLLWLFTFGLLGLGQLADFGQLGAMVRAANAGMEGAEGWSGRAPAYAGGRAGPTHIIEREVVLIRCGHCRTLIRDGQGACPTCGAPA